MSWIRLLEGKKAAVMKRSISTGIYPIKQF